MDDWSDDQRTRLYRGLKEPHDPARAAGLGRFDGTDFTDCPFTALQYAAGRRGVLLVVDAPATARVSEELWIGPHARRLMFWGDYTPHVVAVIPAKDLRALIRRKGIASASEEYKTEVLRRHIASVVSDPTSSAMAE